MPPKRKAVKQLKREDSELSPPPEDLEDAKSVTARAAVDGSSPGKKRKIKKEAVEEEEREETPKKPARKRASKAKVETEEAGEANADVGADETPKSKVKRKAVKKEVKTEDEGEDGDVKTVKKKRQSKAEKEANLIMNPLAARTVGHKLFIGAHVSASGGQSCTFRIPMHMLNVDRSSQCHHEQCSHRRKCICLVSQIAA